MTAANRDKVLSSARTERSRVSDYIGMLMEANQQFIKACGSVAAHHLEETKLRQGMMKLSQFSTEAIERLEPFADKYGKYEAKEPDKLRTTLFPSVRAGAFGLPRDLHALFVMAAKVRIALTIVMQASKELRDEELRFVCAHLQEQHKRQRE